MARFTQKTFAALSLTAGDKIEFEKWLSNTETAVDDLITKFLGDGFKMSISYVFEQNSFCLSIIGTDETKHHKDMIMTSWSDDLIEVFAIAWYKHYIICNGDAWPQESDGNKWG